MLPERLNEQNYFLIKYYYSVVLIVSRENANSDIRSELHKLIDEIEDQEALNLLREDAAAYAVKKKVHDFTVGQLNELQEALEGGR